MTPSQKNRASKQDLNSEESPENSPANHSSENQEPVFSLSPWWLAQPASKIAANAKEPAEAVKTWDTIQYHLENHLIYILYVVLTVNTCWDVIIDYVDTENE